MGSNDPFIMSEIYLNQILKMPIRAIEEETERLMSEELGEEDANLLEEFKEVSYIIEEIEENIKDKSKMIEILSRDDDTPVNESLPRYKKELRQLNRSLKDWNKDLESLKNKYRDIVQDITGTEMSGKLSEIDVEDFSDRSGFTKEQEIKILQIGVELLETKRDLIKENQRKVFNLPSSKELDKIISQEKEEVDKLNQSRQQGTISSAQYRREFFAIDGKYKNMKEKLFITKPDSGVKYEDVSELNSRIYRGKKGIERRMKKERPIESDLPKETISRTREAIQQRKKEREAEETKDSPLPSKSKFPSNIGWKSKLFAQDVADTSKTMRTQARKDKFIEDLSVFLNERTKKGFKGVADIQPYRAKKWQDPHGMGRVRYTSGGQKSVDLAPAKIRIQNLQGLKKIIENAPPLLINENPQIHRRILVAIDKELDAEKVRERKQELKMTRSGEKRGKEAVSNLVQTFTKMRNILKRWDMDEQLPKAFLNYLGQLGKSDLEIWDLEKLSRGILPEKTTSASENKREAEISEVKVSDISEEDKEQKILEINEKYDTGQYKYAGLLSEDMLSPIKEILNDSIKGRTTLYEVIRDYWHLREGGEQETDFTDFLQESIGNLYAELNPYLTGEEQPEEPIEVDNVKRAKVLMEKLKTYMDALPEQVENIENRQTIIGNFERTFRQLDSIMEDDIEDKINSADKDRLDKIRDSLKEFLQVPLSSKDIKQQSQLPNRAKRQMQEVLDELSNYANEVISNSSNEEWSNEYSKGYNNVNDKLKAYIDAHLPLPVREKRQSKEDYEGNLAKRKVVINRLIMGQKVDAKDMIFSWNSKKVSQELEELIEDDIRELDEEYDETDVGERETEEMLEGRERGSLTELSEEEREQFGDITSEEYEEQEAERLEQEERDRIDAEYWESQSEEDDLI